MRVIAGICKGRPLKPVPGRSTRPTTDKVKEALFSRIGPFFDGGSGLDLYSGSGGLGLEALSRGLNHMIFVDRDPKAIAVVKENVRRCGFEEQSEIYRNDARHALKVVEKRGLKFKLLFLDPPYFRQKLTDDLHKIQDSGLMEPGGMAVVEHHESVRLADAYGNLVRQSSETYGEKTVISVYQLSEEDPV
ncbi:MAG TPA: 16S rRNA (guanine(966)-N(2))-methyltransferase RsmD [Bacillales bacterium]|nr:16S rRNA (guanine(966)-N(2))-methyltransferase RsmD [Bacillales bacterium]